MTINTDSLVEHIGQKFVKFAPNRQQLGMPEQDLVTTMSVQEELARSRRGAAVRQVKEVEPLTLGEKTVAFALRHLRNGPDTAANITRAFYAGSQFEITASHNRATGRYLADARHPDGSKMFGHLYKRLDRFRDGSSLCWCLKDYVPTPKDELTVKVEELVKRFNYLGADLRALLKLL